MLWPTPLVRKLSTKSIRILKKTLFKSNIMGSAGSTTSMNPEIFSKMKEEYEANKGGMEDEALYIHLKNIHDSALPLNINSKTDTATTNTSNNTDGPAPLVIAGPSGVVSCCCCCCCCQIIHQLNF